MGIAMICHEERNRMGKYQSELIREFNEGCILFAILKLCDPLKRAVAEEEVAKKLNQFKKLMSSWEAK